MADPSSPVYQLLTVFLPDQTPVNFTVANLDDFYLYSVQISINYAAQLGASLVLLVVLVLLTKPDRRCTPIFLLNSLTLALNFVRNVLLCLYFTGPFSEIYTYFSQDYSMVPRSAYANSVAAVVCTLLLLVCVEACLLLQVQVVCVTLRDLHRRAILVLSAAVGLLAIAFRTAFCIENARTVLALTDSNLIEFFGSASNIVTSVSICWFCAIFVAKLAFAVRQRRKLGLRRFGPMQVILIMGCQTLVVPAIFSILEYFVPWPAMDSNVLTLVAIFLPLSSLWASSAIEANRLDVDGSGPRLPRVHRGAKSPAGSTFRTASSSASPFARKKPSVAGSSSFSNDAGIAAERSPTATSPHGDRFFRSALRDLEKQGF